MIRKKVTDVTAEHRYLFHEGRNHRAYELFGAHSTSQDGVHGFVFRVWAPRAAAVSLVGDFNGWDVNADPMRRHPEDDSIWEIFSAEIEAGGLYKFAVRTDDGRLLYKADPFAFESEGGSPEQGSMRASRLFDIDAVYRWRDDEWIKHRDSMDPYESPINIYEVHLGSWKHRDDGNSYSYVELADMLIPYVKEMGYTHIELLPVMEYPYDGSWGYQITGYYSVTSRYGTPDDFRYFIEAAHAAGIGVILDWVPAHFSKDEHGLAEFDGYPLYEYTDPLKMEHKGWGTGAFDFGRPEVVSFLISNAFFYCDKFHADGLRVDAVAAMLYLNYDRKDGEWSPNDEGGVENKEAMAFLRRLNRDVLSTFKGVLMIAEESTAWPNVTKPPSMGGLGFNFKWNMGWMNDALEYFSTDMLFRSGMHNKLTFAMTYAYSENYIISVSHDEVVHGKRSLLDKMPGEYDDKFAGMRSFFVYMFTHPGKKLNFMGSEFAQFIEWDEKRELDWMLLDYEKHLAMQRFVRRINHYYLDTPALWESDDVFEGFRWIDADNAKDNVYTYLRFGGRDVSNVAAVILNLSGRDFPEYDVGVPECEAYECVINTDDSIFGGRGSGDKRLHKVKKGSRNGYDQYITVSLPKLTAMILEKREKL